jgi:hypothetical protein
MSCIIVNGIIVLGMLVMMTAKPRNAYSILDPSKATSSITHLPVTLLKTVF